MRSDCEVCSINASFGEGPCEIHTATVEAHCGAYTGPVMLFTEMPECDTKFTVVMDDPECPTKGAECPVCGAWCEVEWPS